MALGAFLASLGVMLGAFGAHSLPGVVSSEALPKALDNWRTGASYHLIHSVSLVLLGLLCAHSTSRVLRAAGWLFVFGIFVFGGTLYAMALGAPRILGAVTPLGGLSFIVGWLLLGIAALQADGRTSDESRHAPPQ